jgi:glycosyltransferase involved in cell wall biosynthesis
MTESNLVDIVIVRSNSIVYDPRVQKISESLSKKYSILNIGWNREGLRKEILENNIGKLKLFNLKAPFGKPTLALYLPVFWIWVIFKLVLFRPKVVHACDLDTVLPCYIYKILFQKKLVFDVFDRYAFAHIPETLRLLYSFVNLIEERVCMKSNALIVVAENILKTFNKKPAEYTIIRNCPKICDIDRIHSKDKTMTLVYTGIVVRNRGLERITNAIKDLTGVKLVIAGRCIDKEFLDHILESFNVEYKGLLLPDDSIKLEANSDVMVILYDLVIPINRVANPNKTFEAMMLGLPIITNVTPELIDEVGCGIKVEYNDLNQIQSAVIRLRDDLELRKILGEKGRRAFEQKYNWCIMEQELYNLYERLIK